MNKINWKLRLKNPTFWLTAIPALLLVIQAVASIFGFDLDLSAIGDKILAAVNAFFGLLAVLGIVTDPTTAGVSDSAQALTYTKPKAKED